LSRFPPDTMPVPFPTAASAEVVVSAILVALVVLPVLVEVLDVTKVVGTRIGCPTVDVVV
jgi:hypothetical protein